MSMPRYFFFDNDRIIDEYHNTVCIEVPESSQRDWFHGSRHDMFGKVYLEVSGLYYCVRQAWSEVEAWTADGIIDAPMRQMIAYLFQMTEIGNYWNPTFMLPLFRDPATGCFIEAPVDDILFQFLLMQTPQTVLAVLECPDTHPDCNSLVTEMNDLYDPYVVDMFEFEWSHGGSGIPVEVMRAALEVDPVSVADWIDGTGRSQFFSGAGTEDDPIDLISNCDTCSMTLSDCDIAELEL